MSPRSLVGNSFRSSGSPRRDEQSGSGTNTAEGTDRSNGDPARQGVTPLPTVTTGEKIAGSASGLTGSVADPSGKPETDDTQWLSTREAGNGAAESTRTSVGEISIEPPTDLPVDGGRAIRSELLDGARGQRGERTAPDRGDPVAPNGLDRSRRNVVASSLPPAFLNSPTSRGRRNAANRPPQRRWGLSRRRAGIGFERDIRIEIHSDLLVIDGQQRFRVARGETRDELIAAVRRGLEAQMTSWGSPPQNFYWIPAIQFVVTPGGDRHYERLIDAVHSWGLSTTVDFKIASDQPARLVE